MDEIKLVISAIKAIIFGEKTPECECSEEIIKKAYSLALKQDFAHILAVYLDKLNTGEIKTKLTKQKMLAIYRREQLDFEEERISALLEANSINYIPLKGAVIKNYYPQKWMRTSSDIDILVHLEDIEKSKDLLCLELGYSYVGKSLKDYQFVAKNGVHLELHFALEGSDKANKPMEQVWDYAKPCADKPNRYKLTEEFLIYHTAVHAQYHFAAGGCGLKPLVDLLLLENKLEYNKNILNSLIAEGNCEKFYNGLMHLIRVWFSGEKHTELTADMENYILCGGVYGTRENLGSASVYRQGGRAKYLFSRIFKSKAALTAQYPTLEKYPILLPFYQIKRWFNLLDPKRRRDVTAEAAGSIADNGISKMMKELGL